MKARFDAICADLDRSPACRSICSAYSAYIAGHGDRCSVQQDLMCQGAIKVQWLL